MAALVALTSTGFRLPLELGTLTVPTLTLETRSYLRPGPVQVHAALAEARAAAGDYVEQLDHVLGDGAVRARVHAAAARFETGRCTRDEVNGLYALRERLSPRAGGLIGAVVGEGLRCLGDRTAAREAWAQAVADNPRLAPVAAHRLRDLRGAEIAVAPTLGGVGAVARWERAGCPLPDAAACYAQLQAMSPWRRTAPRLRALQWHWGEPLGTVRALDRAALLAATAPHAGWMQEAHVLLRDPFGPDAAAQTPGFVEAALDATRQAIEDRDNGAAAGMLDALATAGLVDAVDSASLHEWRLARLDAQRRGGAALAAQRLATLRAHAPQARGAVEASWDDVLAMRRADQDDAAMQRVWTMLQQGGSPRRLDAADACVVLAGWTGQLDRQRRCLRLLLDETHADPSRVDLGRRVVDAVVDHLAWEAPAHAEAIWEAAAHAGVDPRNTARGAYWWARTLLDVQAPDARRALAAAVALEPLGVYGIWADAWLTRLHDADTQDAPDDAADTRGPEGANTQTRYLAYARAALRTPVVYRPEPQAAAGWELVQAGLWKLAAEELGAQTRLFGTDAPQAGALAVVAMQTSGDARQAMWTGNRRVSLLSVGAHDLDRVSGQALRATHPVTFGGYARRAATEAGIDAGLVLAVMRRESAFDPTAVSPVGARGLMQMLPATARGYAARLNHQYDRRGGLFGPAASTRLGAEMLARQTQRFGCLEPALSAYAAGPGKAVGWMRRGPSGRTTMPNDLWAERIPYPVVRDYAFEVIAGRAMYAVLLGEAPPAPLCDVLRTAR